MLIKDVLKINKESINPQKYSTNMFYHFSFLAYDNNQTPAFQKGQDILSLKFKITKPCILFNKLNVRFKRIWNIRMINDNYICSSEFLPLILDNNKFLQDYLYYLLTSDKINSLILPDTNGTSSSHQRIDPNMLLNIKIQDVPIDQQQHIVNILGTIDDKIENNEKIIKKHEDFLKLLYLKNFSKNFVNESDYNLCKLTDLASFTGGYSYKGQELIPSKYGLLTIKNFDRNIGFKLDGFKDISVNNKAKNPQYVNLFDIVVAHTDLTQNAEIIGNAEMVLSKEKYDKLIASMDVVIVRPSNYISNSILYLLLHNSEFKKHALGYCSGTTVLHLNKRALNEYVVYIPKDKELIQNVDKIVGSLIKKQALLFQQNIILKNLKNLYLKKFFN